jgi:hypothetical protein
LRRRDWLIEVGTDRGDGGQQFGLGKVFFFYGVRGEESEYTNRERYTQFGIGSDEVDAGQRKDTWRLNE